MQRLLEKKKNKKLMHKWACTVQTRVPGSAGPAYPSLVAKKQLSATSREALVQRASHMDSEELGLNETASLTSCVSLTNPLPFYLCKKGIKYLS